MAKGPMYHDEGMMYVICENTACLKGYHIRMLDTSRSECPHCSRELKQALSPLDKARMINDTIYDPLWSAAIARRMAP